MSGSGLSCPPLCDWDLEGYIYSPTSFLSIKLDRSFLTKQTFLFSLEYDVPNFPFGYTPPVDIAYPHFVEKKFGTYMYLPVLYLVYSSEIEVLTAGIVHFSMMGCVEAEDF